ncbi:hypothetical protein HYN59_06190 [Flavobacterium album]|uniref:DUF6438 domain-containing protein n=1 Tax=Flavobacterium album TaxID=2175091 RepID=A0A2S1QWG5_9FLAO|nr:hypothetical protein HYN59_06190 [Flavobacterium album]
MLFVACKDENTIKVTEPTIHYKPLKQEKYVKAQIRLSKVDSLATDKDVSKFLITIDSGFTNFKLERSPYSDALKNPEMDSITKARIKSSGIKKSFYKADLDNNSYTDLVVLGGWGSTSTAYEGERLEYHSYAVMNFGNKPENIYDLRSFLMPEIHYANGEPYLINRLIRGNDIKEIKLTGKFGLFTEYNESPVDSKIEKIEFESDPCFGSCPYFLLTINKNRFATLIAIAYNRNDLPDNYIEMEGVYTATIKDNEYDQIMELLNYIDFKNLDKSYSVGHTDAPTGIIKITYDNGKIKYINDYGMKGTYGLMAAYNLFRNLRFNQKWTKVEKIFGIKIENVGHIVPRLKEY